MWTLRSFVREWGTFGAGPGQFNGPYGVAVGGEEVFIAVIASEQVQVFV